jgi:Mrp family chromosome partitioning ATPase
MDQRTNGANKPAPDELDWATEKAAANLAASRAIRAGAMTALGGSEPSHPAPTLGDYALSVWRRKRLIALAALAGLAFGLLVLPKVGPHSQYQASVRVEARPLVSSILAMTSSAGVGNQGGSSTKSPSTAGLPGEDTANPWQDLRAAETVLAQLGPAAGDLTAVQDKPRAQWAGVLAGAMRATPVPGSATQFDLSYTDTDPGRATTVVDHYARVMADNRNAADAAITKRGLTVLQQEADKLKAQIDDLSKQADTEANTATKTPASTQTLTRLELISDLWRSKADTIENLHNRMLFLGSPTSVDGSAVVVPASQPLGRGVYATLGLLLGLLGGVGLALVIEAARPRLTTAEDVERATGLPVVNAVPRAGFARRHPLAVADRPSSPAAEGFRKVAAGLIRRGLGDDVRVVVVVSADKGEGKSTLVANLAEALCRLDRSVVMVSSDLRRPTLERLFSVPATIGLAEALQEESDTLIPSLVSVSRNLYLIPAGHPTRNPAELFTSERFAQVVAGLRALDAIVLLDSPPSRVAADVLSLAGVADAVLVVARSGTSRWRSVAEVVSAARREGLPVLGAVLVGAGVRLGYGYGYGYGYSHRGSGSSTRRTVLSGRWIIPGRRNGGRPRRQYDGEVQHVSDPTDIAR